MRLKEGVKVRGLRPELLVAMMVAQEVYDEFGVDMVVTSGTEGTHSRTSLHYSGQAFDLRTKNMAKFEIADVVRTLIERLGTADFDVVREATHIHIEYQPKGE